MVRRSHLVTAPATGSTCGRWRPESLSARAANDSVSLVDLAARKVLAEQDLRPGKIDPGAAGVPGGEYPFAVAWASDTKAYVSSQRDRELVNDGRNAVGMAIGIPKRQQGKPEAPKDDLDRLVDDLDKLDL